MADLFAAASARETAVGRKTHENEARAWDRYTRWCELVGIGDDPFLDGFSRQHRIEIMGAFAVAIREGRFSRRNDDPLAQKSVANTLNFVAATFREHGREDPKKDVDNNVARLLRRQLRSYKKDDPKKVEQKALPLCVIRLILSDRSSELQRAMGDLVAAAHFWAMRSCEYLKVPKQDQRQTKLLCLRNIAFIRDGKHIDHSSPNLHRADCVSVTFEQQKNERKWDTVTQWKTADPVLCPVKIWASIVRRILSYDGTNQNSPVSLVLHRKKLISVTSDMIINLIRDGVVGIGETKLGIERWEVGTHSIRSGAAMAMYLADVPIFSIMLIGRWSSTAFLNYIRKQVQEFSHGISSKMIEIQSFKHVQNPLSGHYPTSTHPMKTIGGDSFAVTVA